MSFSKLSVDLVKKIGEFLKPEFDDDWTFEGMKDLMNFCKVNVHIRSVFLNDLRHLFNVLICEDLPPCECFGYYCEICPAIYSIDWAKRGGFYIPI